MIIARFVEMVTPSLVQKTGISTAAFGVYRSVIENVFQPDLVSVIIGEDYNCDMEDAYRLAWLSEHYGLKEFPYRPGCPALKNLHEEAAKDAVEALMADEGEE